MPMFTRKWDGTIWHVQSHHTTKASANAEAKWLRKMGNRARVVSGTPWANHYNDKSVRYLVYTTGKRG